MRSNNHPNILLPAIIPTFLSVFLLLGCTGVTFQSGDALKSIYSARVAELKATYGSDDKLGQAIRDAECDTSGTARNRILNDFIFLIDNNYTFWEKHLYNKKAFSDFGADVTSTSLSVLSGIVSGGGVQGAKSILSFVAGGITSTKSSFSQDILQSQNLLAIVTKMRAARAEQRIPLQKGMYAKESTAPAPLATYSLDQGFIDLGTYYQAGTFVSALQDIVDKAGEEKSKSDAKIKELKGVTKISASSTTKRLQKWVFESRATKKEREETIDAWLDAKDYPYSFSNLLYDADKEAARQQFLDEKAASLGIE